MIQPQKLKTGDKVAAISLSWGGPGTFPHRYAAGKQQLAAEFGLTIVETPNAMRDADWLHAHPQARAEDLMGAFADPSIKAILSTIGGEDSIRLLPFLDLDLIAAHPKIFMGMSDSTITHLVCHKAGLSSFYGPAVMTSFAENGGMLPYVVDSVRRTLFSSAAIGLVQPCREGWTDEFLDWSVPEHQVRRRKMNPSTGWKFLQGHGISRGPLFGGCLEVLDWLRGTSVWPTAEVWNGAILFIETSEDAPPPAMVRYCLRSFAAMGILRRLSGILFGRPGGQTPIEKFDEYDQAILAVMSEEGLSDLPIVTNMDFGHTDPVFVLPYGVRAEIDCERQLFSILGNAVVD